MVFSSTSPISGSFLAKLPHSPASLPLNPLIPRLRRLQLPFLVHWSLFLLFVQVRSRLVEMQSSHTLICTPHLLPLFLYHPPLLFPLLLSHYPSLLLSLLSLLPLLFLPLGLFYPRFPYSEMSLPQSQHALKHLHPSQSQFGLPRFYSLLNVRELPDSAGIPSTRLSARLASSASFLLYAISSSDPATNFEVP